MARINGQRWLIEGKLLAVYDDSACPICGRYDKVTSSAEYQQNSMLPEVSIKHWDICHCTRCDKRYVSYIEFESEAALTASKE